MRCTVEQDAVLPRAQSQEKQRVQVHFPSVPPLFTAMCVASAQTDRAELWQRSQDYELITISAAMAAAIDFLSRNTGRKVISYFSLLLDNLL